MRHLLRDEPASVFSSVPHPDRLPAGAPRCLACLLLLAGIVACDADFAENLVEQQAERNEQALLEQQREELPLPDPDSVEYLTYAVEDLELDEGFRVDLVDDLVVGAGRTEPEYLFVRFSGRSAALGNVAVDDHGRIFVLETRSDEVRVFAPDGEFLYRFGQPGQGPGDFQSPYGLVIAGAEVHVFHRSFFTSVWSLDGELLRDVETVSSEEAEKAAEALVELAPAEVKRKESREDLVQSAARQFRTPRKVIGRPDGSLIMAFRGTPLEPIGRISTPFSRTYGLFRDGEEVTRYVEAPDWAGPNVAVSEAGDLYVVMYGHLANRRFIVAYAPDGTPRWVVVTPWDPDLAPRTDLRVDGQGRLFAFPNFYPEADDPRSQVEVFDRDGRLLGAGYANLRPMWSHWQVTHGEHVYGVRINQTSGEWEVVRYRLAVDNGA